MKPFSIPWPFSKGRREVGEGRGDTKERAADNEKGKNRDGDEEQLLLEFGVTERLRDFVKSFTVDTFKSFPLQGNRSQDLVVDGSAQSNVRKDLTEWQERHATLVLSKVKEIAQLRYVLCPRHLKDREFWRIYFLLVKSHVAPYEMQAVRQARMKMMEENSRNKPAIELEMSEADHGSDSSVAVLSNSNPR